MFYDDNCIETERVMLDANGEPRMLNVERDRWYLLICLKSGSVMDESKDGESRTLEEGTRMGSLRGYWGWGEYKHKNQYQ